MMLEGLNIFNPYKMVYEVQKVGNFRLPMLVFSPIIKGDEVLIVFYWRQFVTGVCGCFSKRQ
jgi:hypothetical protein